MRGYSAYRQVQGTVQTNRDMEFRLLGQVTGALIRARDGEGTMQDRYNAILWNEKVWDAFFCDLSEPGNHLPDTLKNNLIQLAHWVTRETRLAIEDESLSLESLVTVNREIMEGLKSQPAMAAG